MPGIGLMPHKLARIVGICLKGKRYYRGARRSTGSNQRSIRTPRHCGPRSTLPRIPSPCTKTEIPGAEFRRKLMPLLGWSKRQKPECRHYASIRVTAQSARAATNGLNLVNGFFYTFGLR